MSATAYPAIRAITFDLDDTLWDTWPTIEKAEQRLHEWLAHHYPLIPQRFTRVQLRELRRHVLAKEPTIAHDPTRIRKAGLRLAARQVGYREFDHEAAFEQFHGARNEVMFFADALPALQRLAARYPLGALSNGNADLERIGIGHLFAVALNAGTIGKPKPDPAMFRAACAQLGVAAGQLLHVGDDPASDVVGALDCGLRAVWVNRTGKTWPVTAHRADAEIRSLSELEALLLRWQGTV